MLRSLVFAVTLTACAQTNANSGPADAAVADTAVPDTLATDSGADTSTTGDTGGATDTGLATDTGPVDPALVGLPGIAAWDALAPDEKAKTKTFRTFFLHQSVGGDLEDGADAVGYKFEYVDSNYTALAPGLNGGLFASSNGNPAGKIAEFRKLALATKSTARVAIMKFGYADIVSDKVSAAQTAYQAAVADIKAAGVRVLHVTPPLVYAVPAENAPKMATRAWMRTTFPSDVIFDLQDVESTEPATGARCERGGSWEICNSVRSTAACPSLNQGIDAPTGQGHICFEPHAKRFAKAYLYAIYLAGK
ncbi:MAG: hypothetical protein IPJ34_35695 [Myxococcales bacterium]|nr:hypothetical protein [Myxococcales bacterium]